MAARKRRRYLAPIALVAVIVATLLVIHADLRTKHNTGSVQRTIPISIVRHQVQGKRFYVVKRGDSLSVISAKTGISVASLEALNPTAAPNALQAGQRLRLR